MTRSLTPKKYAQALYETLMAARTTEQQNSLIDNFIRLLFEQRDRRKWSAILRSLKDIFQQQGKFFEVEVTARVDFSPAEKKSLQSALEKAFEGDVQISFFSDPALLGGLRLKVNNVVYDGSLQQVIVSLSQQLHP